jgi:hypothetical protein
MNTGKLALAIGLAIIAAALLTASVFAYMGTQGTYNPYTANTNGAYSGGMMGGAYNTPQSPAQPNIAAPTYPYQYGSGGCCGRGMRYFAPAYPTTGATTAPITIETAATIAQQYVTQLNNPDLAVREVEEYTQNFYIQVYEKSTGTGAFELLIDKYTGSIYPEQGPNMMWNTKYGMHNSIMGWSFGNPTEPMTITVQQAENFAQQYLNTYVSGTTAGEAEAFYGYYHVMVLSQGEGYGMLSVNGYTGQVWYHNWHGAFVQELELS